MKKTKIKIKGLTPYLMHNGQLADPLNPATKALAKLTAKRKKTEDDHLEVRRCEWYGGLYVGADGAPCIPGEVFEACLVDGAKKYKLGKVAKGGVVVPADAPLQYSGPKTADGLWAHGGYLKVASVRVGTSRVIRSRPIFPEWAAEIDVLWDPELVADESQLVEIARAAGLCGVGDWRPKFGRFEVL